MLTILQPEEVCWAVISRLSLFFFAFRDLVDERLRGLRVRVVEPGAHDAVVARPEVGWFCPFNRYAEELDREALRPREEEFDVMALNFVNGFDAGV